MILEEAASAFHNLGVKYKNKIPANDEENISNRGTSIYFFCRASALMLTPDGDVIDGQKERGVYNSSMSGAQNCIESECNLFNRGLVTGDSGPDCRFWKVITAAMDMFYESGTEGVLIMLDLISLYLSREFVIRFKEYDDSYLRRIQDDILGHDYFLNNYMCGKNIVSFVKIDYIEFILEECLSIECNPERGIEKMSCSCSQKPQ